MKRFPKLLGTILGSVATLGSLVGLVAIIDKDGTDRVISWLKTLPNSYARGLADFLITLISAAPWAWALGVPLFVFGVFMLVRSLRRETFFHKLIDLVTALRRIAIPAGKAALIYYAQPDKYANKVRDVVAKLRQDGYANPKLDALDGSQMTTYLQIREVANYLEDAAYRNKPRRDTTAPAKEKLLWPIVGVILALAGAVVLVDPKHDTGKLIDLLRTSTNIVAHETADFLNAMVASGPTWSWLLGMLLVVTGIIIVLVSPRQPTPITTPTPNCPKCSSVIPESAPSTSTVSGLQPSPQVPVVAKFIESMEGPA